MPYKEHEIKKVYYTISEAAKIAQVPTSSLRFWDTKLFAKFIGEVKKDSHGDRRYTVDQVEKIKMCAKWKKTPLEIKFTIFLEHHNFKI